MGSTIVEITQGSYKEVPLVYEINGIAQNITGASINAYVKRGYVGATLLHLSTTSGSIVITGASTGTYKLIFSSADTNGLDIVEDTYLKGQVYITLASKDYVAETLLIPFTPNLGLSN